MKSGKRRHLLRTAAALAAGGVAAYAAPGHAQLKARAPFIVPATFIPIAGTTEVYPVRRIYCIGHCPRAPAP